MINFRPRLVTMYMQWLHVFYSTQVHDITITSRDTLVLIIYVIMIVAHI